VYTHNKNERGKLHHLEGHYLHTVSDAKIRWNGKVVDRTKLGKTQQVIGLLCAVLKVMRYSFQAFSVIIQLPHYIL